jgi:ACS family sodium-dependent inorganic phosphate cotransporter
MNFDIKQLGIVSAFPYLAMALMLSLGGYWADSLQNKGVLTTTQVRKYFNCGAYVLKAIFMVVGAYFLTPAITITCIIIAVGLGGFAWCGFSVNLLDIAPQFAGVLMGITNTFGTMAGIISPQVTGLIVQNQDGAEWQIVFYIASVIYIIGAIVYWIWASGEVQPWAIAAKEEDDVLDDVEMTKLFKERYAGVRYSA